MDFKGGTPKISFCITCKGRLHHLEQTLPQNIANNADYPNVQFVVVDYDSMDHGKKDAMETWMKEHYSHEIESGLIKYVKLAHPADFKMSHAKNVAHRMADGDILCNLDADNITAPGFAKWVVDEFTRNARSNTDICIRPNARISALHKLTVGDTTGVNGRIVASRKHFEQVHGYDEDMNTTRSEDSDFVARLEAIGVKPRNLDLTMYGHVLQHTNAARTENMSAPDKSEVDNLLAQGGFAARVRRFVHGAKHDLQGKDPIANPDGKCGCAEVFVNFSDRPETIAPLEQIVQRALGQQK